MANVPYEESGQWRNEICKCIPYIDIDYDILVSVKVIGIEIFNKYKNTLPFYINIIKEGINLYEQW